MSEPLDLSGLSAEPTDMGHAVPNHRASAGRDTPPTEDKPKRRGFLTGERQPRQRRQTKPAPPNIPGQYVQPLTDIYLGAAMLAMPFKPRVAITIMAPVGVPTEDTPNPPTVAQNCAEAWDKAAQRSPAVRRFLDGMLTASVAGTLIAAHLPIVLALLADSPISDKIDPDLMAKMTGQQSTKENAE